MSQQAVMIRRSTTSTGLRMSFTMHLPPEVGSALETLASYLYDQAVAEGAPMPCREYLEGELSALDADLAYIEYRFQGLAKEVESRDDALREISAMLGEVRHRLDEVRADA